MTLTTRIVGALVLAALIPMAVVLAVPLSQSKKSADDQTAGHLARVREQTERLIAGERAAAKKAADRAAEALGSDHTWQTAVIRGPEADAQPVAAALGSRFGLDRVKILGASGTTLAAYETAAQVPGEASLDERRQVKADGETLTLIAARTVGPAFAEEVSAITLGEAHLQAPGGSSCRSPSVELPVADGVALCVGVTPADARELRGALLRSFAGVAPVAFLAALAVGLVLAARISRPVRDLAVRAESIAAEHSRPMTLLAEPDETRRMTLAFDQMLDSLVASERRRLAAERVAAWEEIAKRLAHEIKNPLSPIKLAVENLRKTKERFPQAFDEAFAVETRTILEEVASLGALVDEFAQFARLPRPQPTPCAPRAVVDSALALYAARIEAMRVAVTIDDAAAPKTIAVDAEQVGRVLKNVIANALDAMEGSQDRRLTIAVRPDGDRIQFEIADTGRGFDAETLRRVFEPYFTTRHGRGGTGLGMAIARRIAVEHGGSLAAKGAPGRGATFTLTLPVAGKPGEAA
jgi:signal transduction histidine kinase